ncbi:predicted protein [Nematostella vectensis]|uniref:Uncharacterized protein n=1 Tax=Nematostella vectensis TaxID=45351 RepID=A7RXS2_NEMVE|nr:predicted protein [Nematostella vectensis]|eukprot:XP_001635776.1 predicted protein [Nematostella vectensis]
MGDYPGDGYKMSGYGLKTYNPEEERGQWLETCKHDRVSTYDRINTVALGYNQKLHRDDREHAKSRGLRVNDEETAVRVPVLSSSVYGHPARRPLEFQDRTHVRVELCKKDFLRLGGTDIGNNPNLH